MRLLAKVGTGLAAVAVLVVSPAVPTGANTQAGSPAFSRDPAADPDLQRIAESLGTSVAEVDKRVGWQNDVGVALARLTEAHPDDFAWSMVTSEKPAVATIWFKGDVPAEAMSFFSDVRSDVDIHLRGDYGLNEEDIADLGWTADAALRATGNFEQTAAGFDPAKRQVTIDAKPGPNVSPERASESAREALNVLPAEFRSNAAVHITSR